MLRHYTNLFIFLNYEHYLCNDYNEPLKMQHLGLSFYNPITFNLAKLLYDSKDMKQRVIFYFYLFDPV